MKELENLEWYKLLVDDNKEELVDEIEQWLKNINVKGVIHIDVVLNLISARQEKKEN